MKAILITTANTKDIVKLINTYEEFFNYVREDDAKQRTMIENISFKDFSENKKWLMELIY